MALRYAVHGAAGELVRCGEATYNMHEPDENSTPLGDRCTLYRQIAPGLQAGQRLTTGWDECVFCGAPLTDDVSRLSTRAYCSIDCSDADAC